VTITRQPAAGAATEIIIAIANLLRAHKLAVDRYRLAIWTQWPGRDIEAASNANGQALKGAWPSIENGAVTVSVVTPADLAAGAALQVRLAFVDPLGRLSTLTAISVP
jgi:hypothetical protein